MTACEQREWKIPACQKVPKGVKSTSEFAGFDLLEPKDQKRLEEWRATVAFNKARRMEKQARSAQNRALKGHGPAIDKSTLTKDKTQFTFVRAGKMVLKAADDSKKRKRMARCHKCGANREVDGPVFPGWTCQDNNQECMQARKCYLCGREAEADGPSPPKWKCEDSGEYECLSPSERQGKYAKK